MLKVLKVISPYSLKRNIDFETLFKDNHSFIFVIEAPLYWWIDVDGIKYGFDLSDFSDDVRQNLSLSTNIGAMLSLTYQEIVEICKDYQAKMYRYEGKSYQWPNEREWNDFCETLLDIKGVRDLIKEET